MSDDHPPSAFSRDIVEKRSKNRRLDYKANEATGTQEPLLFYPADVLSWSLGDEFRGRWFVNVSHYARFPGTSGSTTIAKTVSTLGIWKVWVSQPLQILIMQLLAPMLTTSPELPVTYPVEESTNMMMTKAPQNPFQLGKCIN